MADTSDNYIEDVNRWEDRSPMVVTLLRGKWISVGA
jgi:hypothetical protein